METNQGQDQPLVAGATITSNYLVREQEVVGVNKSDLEDLLEFDTMATGLGAFGVFLMSGALWLGLEKLFESDSFKITPLLAFCIASVLFGAVSSFVGMRMRNKKRSRIQRIFDETSLQKTTTAESSGSQATQSAG